MGIRRLFVAWLCVLILGLPLHGGRTTNGTTDFLQASMNMHGIFGANVSGTQAQGTVAFLLNLISLPSQGGSLPTCGVHCAEIVNVIAGHNAITNGCLTTTGACLDIFICNTNNASCTSGKMIVDITTPSVGEAETVWPVTLGLHHYAFQLNRTAANMAMYVDGVLVSVSSSNTAGDPGPINYAGAGGGCGAQTCALTVMASESGVPGQDNFANGTISDLAFWNVTLAPGEITTLANCAPPNRVEPEHVHYFPIYGVDSPEPSYNALPIGAPPVITPLPLTVTGTTRALQQVGCQPGGAYH